MQSRQLKYNPGLQGDEELVRSFVVRQGYLELILETIRENNGRPVNQHLLLVGPRGSGKTMLARRVAAEITLDRSLSERWYPIVFAEEAYLVSNPGEFWLEALFHLADQTQEERWRQAYQDLQGEPDPVRLRERALAQLMDFADAAGKRVLLIVENLNILLGEQMVGQGDWDLRHTLLNEPRLMLLGTATARFDEIDNIDRAWFELLSTHTLAPLTRDECQTLWEQVTGEEIPHLRVRPIMILTGGSPRLIAILAGFAAHRSFREFMDDLIHLIDEHTEYFKSFLDHLAATERRVFVSLLETWDPVGAREVARQARMGVSQASALLNRLVQRGAVMTVDGSGRTRYYQVAERLYNIYYLMRRRSNPSNRVRAAVNFMVHFYADEDELADRVARLAAEACGLDPERRQDHYWAFQGILEAAPNHDVRQRILEKAPARFFEYPDLPEGLRELAAPLRETGPLEVSPEVVALVRRADSLSEDPKTVQEALAVYDRVVADYGGDREVGVREAVARALFNKGVTLGQLGRSEEEILMYDRVVAEYGGDQEAGVREAVVRALVNKGVALGRLGRSEEAVLVYDRVVAEYGGDREVGVREAVARALVIKGYRLWELGRSEEEILVYDRVVAEYGGDREAGLREQVARAMFNKGVVLGELGRSEEAVLAYDRVVAEHGGDREVGVRERVARAMFNKGVTLGELGRSEEEILVYDRVVAEYGGDRETGVRDAVAWAMFNKGYRLGRLGRSEEEILVYDRVVADYGGDREAGVREAVAGALVNKGYRLGELGRSEEEILVYDRVVAEYGGDREAGLREQVARALFNKGVVLGELGRHEEAEESYRKVIELEGPASPVWEDLIELRLTRGDDPDEILKDAEQYLEQVESSADRLNSIAWTFYEADLPDYLPQAETWAREAVAKKDDDWDILHSLLTILGAQGKWSEALALASPLLAAAQTEDGAIHEATEFCVDAAAAGYGREALQLVVESPASEQLESLAVGLRIFLGERPRVAQEIFEVGQDVAQRIRDRQEARVPGL